MGECLRNPNAAGLLSDLDVNKIVRYEEMLEVFILLPNKN